MINLFVIPVVGKGANEYVGYSIFILCVILLPLLVLTSKDALDNIKESKNSHVAVKIIVYVCASLPALVFGLFGVVIGVSIILWVLYNVFVDRQPEFIVTAIFGGFGIGPALIGFGIYCLHSLRPNFKN
jgi:ABC-type phosphate transport system permease subunit